VTVAAIIFNGPGVQATWLENQLLKMFKIRMPQNFYLSIGTFTEQLIF